MGTGCKNFPSGSWLWEKLYHITNANSKQTLSSREPCPSPPFCCYLIDTINVSSKGHSVCHASCFRIVRNMVREVDSMIVSPLSHLSGCEMSSLVSSNAVCDTMTMDKTFRKSTDGGFGRSILYRKGKSITRISVYSSKNKHCFVPQRKWSTCHQTGHFKE